MTNRVIPEAAVEAAVEQLNEMGVSVSKKYMRAALEAAAPGMLAEVWEEGLGYALPGTKRGLRTFEEMRLANPYR